MMNVLREFEAQWVEVNEEEESLSDDGEFKSGRVENHRSTKSGKKILSMDWIGLNHFEGQRHHHSRSRGYIWGD